MAVLLDGKALAARVRAEVARRVAALKERGVVPGLAVVMAGDDPASRIYVRNKLRDCEQVGIESFEHRLPADVPQRELTGLVEKLNADPKVSGILVQLPLPAPLNSAGVIDTISPFKDVDAFHPSNVGRIMIGRYQFLPCTPAGVMRLLDAYGIDPAGKTCVVVGRSDIVGKPMAMLLLHRDATVTICHSRTQQLPDVTARADILVSAVGKLRFITADMVKPGAVVVDVGMNRTPEGRLAGDVDFGPVSEKASYITPVPGGVGPMTRAMLLENTVRAAALQAGLPGQG